MIDLLIQGKDVILTQLQTNQFFSGGLLLSFVAGLLIYLKYVPIFIFEKVLRHLRFSLYFDDTDNFYIYFNRWIEDKHPQKIRNAHIKLFEGRHEHDAPSFSTDDDEDDEVAGYEIKLLKSKKNKKEEKKFYLTHKNDGFVLWYKGWPLWIRKEQEKLEQAKDIYQRLFNSYEIYGFLAKKRIMSLIDDVMKYEDKKKKQTTYSLYVQRKDDWFWGAHQSGRSVDSIVMDKDVKRDLLKDVKVFFDSRDWYVKRGIPYKRGYLFYGPPGTGKSSIIKALSSKISELNNERSSQRAAVYYLSLASDDFGDKDLMNLISSMGSRNPILVIEDIDAVFDKRTNITKSNLSFSGLINALDGLFTKDGMITMMTTNHVDKLDPALIRPGRIDKKIELGFPSIDLIQDYFSLFYKQTLNLKEPIKKDISMSAIQEICITNRNDYKQAKIKIEELLTV